MDVGDIVSNLENMRQIRAKHPHLCGSVLWKMTTDNRGVEVWCSGIGGVKFPAYHAIPVLQKFGVRDFDDLCIAIETPPRLEIESEGW